MKIKERKGQKQKNIIQRNILIQMETQNKVKKMKKEIKVKVLKF